MGNGRQKNPLILPYFLRMGEKGKKAREKTLKFFGEFRQKVPDIFLLFPDPTVFPALSHLHNICDIFLFTKSYSHYPHLFPHPIFLGISRVSARFPQISTGCFPRGRGRKTVRAARHKRASYARGTAFPCIFTAGPRRVPRIMCSQSSLVA